MHEIEVKVLHINKTAMEKKILALGAIKKGRFLIVEKNFDFKNRSISRAKKSFRLRSVGKRVELTVKSQLKNGGKFKTREETETTVGDFKITEKILTQIGFVCIKHREKYRTSYQKGAVKFEIDEYPGVPAYLEIEGSKKDILTYLELLHIPLNKTSALGATEVLKKHGVNHTFLKFTDSNKT